MSTIVGKDDFQFERQWILLEEHYISGKPIVAHILEIAKGRMLVDIGGIQGYVEQYVFSLTKGSSKEASEDMQGTLEQFAQQRLMNMRGKEILLRVVEVDRTKQHLKLSQRLHDINKLGENHKGLSDEFEIGSVHKGFITSINTVLVTVDLGGVIGKLPSKQPSLDQSKFVDLSTILRLGQEIEVTLIKKQRKAFLLSLMAVEPH